MKRLALVLLLVGGFAHADVASDLMGRLISGLKAGTDCAKSSATQPWCQAATGWADAKPAALPKAKLLVGVTVTLVDGGVVTTELRDHTAMAAVALAGTADQPTIAIAPIAYDSAATSAKAIGAVTMVLKGKSKAAEVPGGVDTMTSALANTKPAALAQGAHGWSWPGDGAGELRKIGSLWVAYQPTKGGAYVTILTEKAK
jgi:hypothetical protein